MAPDLRQPLLRSCGPSMLQSAPAIMAHAENETMVHADNGTESTSMPRIVPESPCTEMESKCRESDDPASLVRTTVSMLTIAEKSAPTLVELKRRVLETLSHPAYQVEEMYHKSGVMQAIVRHISFNNFTLLVIFLNTIWIAVDTDLNKADMLCNAPVVFQVVNNLFCFFFTSEVLVRAFAFKSLLFAFTDPWFVFDAFIVAMMVWETWVEVALFSLLGGSVSLHTRASSVLRIFRMLRLTRVARVARLLHSCPELIILIEGMAMALRSVSCTFGLLVLVIYIYGVMLTQLFSGTEIGHDRFDNVPQAMIFLLLQVLCGFDADIIYMLLAEHWVYFLIYITFLIIAGQTIMNMLIAVLCDVVSNVASDEKEHAFVEDVEYEMLTMIKKLEENAGHFVHGGKLHAKTPDADSNVSKEDFHEVMEDPSMVRTLEGLGVDVVALLDFAWFVFRDRDLMPLPEFLNMVIQFRGAKACTVKDVVDMRKFVSMELSVLESKLKGEDGSYVHSCA